ncbi:DNA repair protein RecN [Thalassotalea aquiviva]|uniref:DNA repair protein RecN n=1 Tax=Thalassotalea aquiviva TaxID=3242415 RepID=UPI00352B64E3
MIVSLSIKNFAIVDYVEIDWQRGMTVITGETGAGKSIAIDALGLCLGDRALANAVRPGTEKAELIACFDLTNSPSARQWLNNQDLLMEDECIIRRVINKEGRSKAYINGSTVPLALLRQLGPLLLNIHGQHDHQLLMKNNEQRRLLDDYADHQRLLNNLQDSYRQWRQLQREIDTLEQAKQQRAAQKELLRYQVKELDEFNLQEFEFIQLENDYKRNSNAQQLIQLSSQCIEQLSANETFNVLANLQRCNDELNKLAEIDIDVKAIAELINNACIMVEEADRDLNYYQQSIDIDPQSFALIEERYSNAISLARKHQVAPELLAQHHSALTQQLEHLTDDDSRLEHIYDELETCLQNYQRAAEKLSKSRQKSAKVLAQKITASLHQLNMPNAQFKVLIKQGENPLPNRDGIDIIDFVVSMNPGQPLESIHKVASGGELSRISLAIQVILAERVITPTLIFDEVDVGISGPTAAMVGKQLRLLANNTQVICVTHLPQVASKGHQQLFVAKITDGKQTATKVRELQAEQRTREIARLLAGDTITESSLANARELLAS